MTVYVRIAVRNLLAARRRTLLLGGALSAVTILLVLLMALSQGLSDTIVRSATTLAAGHVNVAGFYKASARDAAPILTDAPKLKKLVAENTPNLAYVIDRQRGWCKIVSDTGSMNTGLAGIDIAEESELLDRLQLAKESDYVEGGRDIIDGDPRGLGEPGTAMLFAGQAKRLEVGVGDMLTITTETLEGRSNTGEVRIVAVARDVGMLSNWTVFVTKKTILELYQLKPDATGAIMVYLDDIDRASETMEHLTAVLTEHGYTVMEHDPRPFYMKLETVWNQDWTGQQLDLTIWQDEVSFLNWVVTAVDFISYTLVIVLLIIICVGIMNTMWIAVRERTSEVGTLRAIGMARSRVLLMFMLEALILAFAATSAGAVIGSAIGIGVNAAEIGVPVAAVRAILMSDVLHLSVGFGQVFRAVLLFTALTGLSALAPALRAARLQPVTAIHHIG